MSMYGKNHYNIVISPQLITINEKKKKKAFTLNISDWESLSNLFFFYMYLHFGASQVAQ